MIGAAPFLFGFSTTGVVAGSSAAAIQASIGNVAAGSVFSTIQSIAMSGTASTTLYSGITTAATGIAGYFGLG